MDQKKNEQQQQQKPNQVSIKTIEENDSSVSFLKKEKRLEKCCKDDLVIVSRYSYHLFWELICAEILSVPKLNVLPASRSEVLEARGVQRGSSK